MKQIFFYQNNPCVIVRDINDEFAEVQISHHFAANMELSGRCQGCLIGDLDNKIPCTCDEYSWVIEEVQDEENKLIVMVEKRLLSDKPVEFKVIEKLKSEIDSLNASVERIKLIHKEWSDSANVKKELVDSLHLEKNSLEKQIEALSKSRELEIEGIEAIKGDLYAMLVDIERYGSVNQRISRGEYEQLLARDKKLAALEAGGVDNWEWYEESLSKANIK